MGRLVPFKELQRTVAAWHNCLGGGYPASSRRGQVNAISQAAEQLGMPSGNHNTVARRLTTAAILGLDVAEWGVAVSEEEAARRQRAYDRSDADYRRFARKPSKPPAAPPSVGGGRRKSEAQPAPPPAAPGSSGHQDPLSLVDKIIPLLRRGPLTGAEIAEKLSTSVELAAAAIGIAHARGAVLQFRASKWHLDNAPAMGSQRGGDAPQLVSDRNGVIRFGAIGDTHLGSKYAREDCLSDYYDHVEHRGIKVVLHAGNWIDGEAPFNRHDLLVHGMDPQMQHLAKNYPQRPGVETWAITGEDHEGWYSRREGIDVGRYAERVMQDNGRSDWRDMGFMETFINLVHGETGMYSRLCLMHPGGGSAYAVSYAAQKIVEGFDGGDKPAVLLIGHYHKSSYNLIRNVHTVQVGCFEDQTVFMRKQKLAAHLGGWFCELRLDPETGAVIEFTGTFRNYFVRDYYRGRWSQHGPVSHAPRSAA